MIGAINIKIIRVIFDYIPKTLRPSIIRSDEFLPSNCVFYTKTNTL